MKKRVYAKPVLESETFVPQNYIAACGDTGFEYNFQCDAMGGIVGAVFYSNGDDKFIPFIQDRLMGIGYEACGKKHKTQIGDEFIEGWYVTGKDAAQGKGLYTKVMIWRGAEGNNIHCTKELDKSKWETAKS